MHFPLPFIVWYFGSLTKYWQIFYAWTIFTCNCHKWFGLRLQSPFVCCCSVFWILNSKLRSEHICLCGNCMTFAISKANWSEHMKGSSLIDIQITWVMGVLGCKTFSNILRWIYRWLLVLDVGFCSRKKHIGFLYICPSLVLSQFNSVCNLNLLENWCQLQHFWSTLL